MNGEGQRPGNQPDAHAAHDAPEPGNAKQPPGLPALNGSAAGQGQEGGGGKRKFRRQRRGGRGRGRNKQGGSPQQNQPGYVAPLDAQGRIVDVENDVEGAAGPDGDDEGPDETAPAQQADGNVARPAPAPVAAIAAAAPAEGNTALPPPPPAPPAADGNAQPQELQPSAAPSQAQPGQPGPQGQSGQPQQGPQGQQGQPQQGQPQQGHQQHGRGGRHQRHQNQQHREQNHQNHQNNQNQNNQQKQPQQQRQPEVMVASEGVLDIDHRGNGKLRLAKFNFLPQQDDVEVPRHLIDRDKLRPGSLLVGQSARRNGRLQLVKADTVEGLTPQQAAARTAFSNLTVVDPDDRLVMETTSKETLTRIIDIVSPIGLGQRMLIVAPPKTGKTIMLQKISHAITANKPDVVQFVLLVDERPEEVTDFRRTVKADVFASSADRPTDEHLHVAEMAMERAKRLVEGGKDVVILLDSITRLSRAYNKEVESSGRTLSGGVDSRALERPKRLFGAARNAEEGGSLTIIATALIDTGSRMDEVIFEEFKGTGNSEINLDRALSEKRVWPAINIQTSGTRKEEKLFSQHEYEKVKKLRGALYALKPTEAMERLIKSMNEFKSNAEFLDAI
jgi:transcription termination factor Rho